MAFDVFADFRRHVIQQIGFFRRVITRSVKKSCLRLLIRIIHKCRRTTKQIHLLFCILIIQLIRSRLRRYIIRQICSHILKILIELTGEPKLVYVEAQYQDSNKLPLIYVYVHDLRPWGQCRAGFRGARSLEEFGDHIAGFGDVTIVCESLKWFFSRQVQRIQVKVEPYQPGHQSNARIPHYGIANVGILALGRDCIRIIVDGRQSLVCP